jgi:Domain of unknown function (DUF4123)
MTTGTHGPLWSALESLPPRGAHEHRYLLVNQAAFGIDSPLIRRLGRFKRAALLRQPVDACTDGATPFLLLWEGVSDDKPALRAVQALCQEACYACAVSVIDSTLDLEPLAAALTARCTVRLPDDMNMVLRFFDTRVMTALIDAQEPKQKDAFFSCATHWLYSGREGSLDVAPTAGQAGHDSFVTPLTLIQRQQNELIDAGEADLVIGLLANANVEPLIELPVAKRHIVVSQFLADAKAWGLSETPDFTGNCCLALSIGPDFATLAPWKQWLPEIKAGHLKFGEALARAESETL